ncbi:MAG: hypothetical protein AAB316_15130 [Bacteroidota bacterium]
MVFLIFYLLYASWSGKITPLVYVAIAANVVEIAILMLFKWTCPLTLVARKYSDSTKPNFDIYLPEWLATHNKLIFGACLAAGLGMVLWRLLKF